MYCNIATPMKIYNPKDKNIGFLATLYSRPKAQLSLTNLREA